MADIQLATKLDLDGKVNNSQVLTNVPANAKFTDTVYTHPASHPASMITGLPTSLPANGGNADTVGGFTVGVSVPANAKFTDTTYTHPSNHAASMITGLATVATSGSYNDLSDTPNIPAQLTKISELENDSGFIDGAYDNTASGLTATTIQGAIDELKALFDTLSV